jgi:siroheme synthase-like protein
MLLNFRPCFGRALVVGVGRIGGRKVRRLVEAGFAVTAVDPTGAAAIADLPGVQVRARPFTDGDLEGHALIIAATADRAVNRRVGELARAAGLPVCVCDAAGESTFWGVATWRRRRITIGVASERGRPRRASRALRKLRRRWPLPPGPRSG